MTEGDLTISQAIDRMILSTDSASMLFEKYCNHFIENRVSFLSELAVRLSSDRLELFCDSIVWNEPSQPKYIYEEVHLAVAKRKIRPSDSSDHMVIFRQKELAYELWKKNRFIELQSILSTVQSRLQSERARESQKQSSESKADQPADEKIGMYWNSSDKDLLELFKELIRSGLISEDTEKTLFLNTFTRKRDLRAPSIQWKSSLVTLGRLFFQLVDFDLLIKPDGFYEDFKEHRYFLPIGKQTIGSFKDAYIKSQNPSPKSRNIDTFHLIDQIIERIVSSTK